MGLVLCELSRRGRLDLPQVHIILIVLICCLLCVTGSRRVVLCKRPPPCISAVGGALDNLAGVYVVPCSVADTQRNSFLGNVGCENA